ncbi:NeuD/PglB/VioB family sugar acetyltransferase [Hymenobacter psoromatis]|uniref:NeuD/PglB/VioB family sugar acetyltransferase n=1 Tax=Hymenobacter psoromatis TaxID=1484116 RepID=UPI001CC096EB|nr:NeuD/PglB/VioB family sugar acetyltransferase [Hymenobacter psoromatis]
MLVIGAKGHAKEILDILIYNEYTLEEIYFFDDISIDLPNKLFNRFPIIRTLPEVTHYLSFNPSCILGIGGVYARKMLYHKMTELGGKVETIIAQSSKIGKFNVEIAGGVNIMHQTVISSSVSIGIGSIINAASTIHHDVTVGAFCEISPNATITGNVEIGNNTYVGTGAIILPRIKIGDNVIVGAGAVVTKDVPSNNKVVGVPAKLI